MVVFKLGQTLLLVRTVRPVKSDVLYVGAKSIQVKHAK